MTARQRAQAIAEARERAVAWDDLRDRRSQRAIWERYTASLRAPMPNRGTRSARVWLGASLASMAVVAAALTLYLTRPAPHSPAPPASADAVAELRQVAFDPGSLGVLSPDAEVETTASAPGRFEVTQSKGRVQYDIRHDPEREFVVHVADVTVTVLGTQFSVELRDSLVSVRVDRGRVRVFDGERNTELVTGEAIEVHAFYAQGDADADSGPGSLEAADTGDSGAGRATSTLGPAAKPPSIDELLAQADAARAAGRSGQAASLLRTVLARHPTGPQASNTEFTLARVERSRGHHLQAAQSFERCAGLGGTLASEALAEAAASWLTAGDQERARGAAQRYVRRYPNGPHAQKMHAIAE